MKEINERMKRIDEMKQQQRHLDEERRKLQEEMANKKKRMMEKFQKLMKSNKKKLTKEQIYEEILKDDEDFDTNNTQSRNQSKVNDEPTGETKEEQTYDKDQTTMNNNQTSPKKEKVEEQKIQNSSPKKEEKKFLTRDEVNEKVQQRKGELENTVKDFMIKAKDNEKKLKEESEKDPENKEKRKKGLNFSTSYNILNNSSLCEKVQSNYNARYGSVMPPNPYGSVLKAREFFFFND